MSDILQHILARRSIRKFTAEAVSDEDILRLLQAAMAAPSASNRKPWEFVVVTDPEVRQKLRNVLVLGRYAAPLGIAVCGNLRRAYPWPVQDFWIEDCSAAMQNILLTATGLGLGCVWIGVHPVKPLELAVRSVLALPKHVVPLGVTWIGHPAETKPPRTQYDEQAVFWQQYRR
jgi:nitroreductase